jgi:hypothetical protein
VVRRKNADLSLTIVDTGYTTGTRWRYHIPLADRARPHRVRVTPVLEELHTDRDDASGTYQAETLATDTETTDTDNTATLPIDTITTGTVPSGAVYTLSGGSLVTGASNPKVVIDGNGIEAFDSGGSKTVDINSDGSSHVLVGTFKNALSGNYWEISSAALVAYLQGHVATNDDVGYIAVSDRNMDIVPPGDTADEVGSIHLYSGATSTDAMVRLVAGLVEYLADEQQLGSGWQARGFASIRAYNATGTGRDFGHGVTYGGVSRLQNVPSSITLTSAGTNSNVSNVQAVDFDVRGFRFQATIDANTGGVATRTYVTVGN